MTPAPLVLHLVYRFDCGGLETLLAECINRTPAGRFRHAIVCLTDYTAFVQKIVRPGTEIFALHKAPGAGLSTHATFWKLLRQLRPAVLHTYNIGTLEYAFTATMAGVPVRIHAEHGRNLIESAGNHRKYNLLRRALAPFIHRFIAVSHDLQDWLKDVIRVPEHKIAMVVNGVDTAVFTPRPSQPTAEQPFVIGTVGRVGEIKRQADLVDAFIHLLTLFPEKKSALRLAIIGDGPLLSALRKKVAAAGIEDQVWLPGARDDIAELMKTFSVFVLPSLSEATPVTILEAMATGLPVIATRVGGVPHLVRNNVTGQLVAAGKPAELAEAIAQYVRTPQLGQQHGAMGRQHIEKNHSIDAMVAGYLALYAHHLHGSQPLI